MFLPVSSRQEGVGGKIGREFPSSTLTHNLHTLDELSCRFFYQPGDLELTTPATLFSLKEEMSREIENVTNRLYRHCRIGRVEKKMQTINGWVKPPRSIFSDHLRPQPTTFFSGGYVHTTSSGDLPVVPPHGTMM